MNLNQRQIQHLLLRLGFGDNFRVVQSYINKSAEDIISDQFKKSGLNGKIEFEANDKLLIERMQSGIPQMQGEEKAEARKQLNKQRKDIIRSLNRQWIRKMATSASGVQDKMAFFWHDHFACSSNNPLFVKSYLNTLQKHALGNFGTLLKAVSKEPAMLIYLNNQQNKKGAPNENFAREVMELFTLGRDHEYTEADIKEAARAFTGWSGNKEGKFHIRKKQHDYGVKVIFGKKGKFDGDDVLDMLLEKKRTAQYISGKWVRFFVTEKGNPELEKKTADSLYNSGYDIKTALLTLFSDPMFYEEKYIGTQIKSPIELLAGLQRMLRVTIDNEKSLIYLQNMMGQRLFYPPNVSGWASGTNWVDSSTLMFRVSLPNYIFKAALLSQFPNKSFDDNAPLYLKKRFKKLSAQIDFGILRKELKSLNTVQLGKYIIQDNNIVTDPGEAGVNLVDKIVYFTSKPEFQLC